MSKSPQTEPFEVLQLDYCMATGVRIVSEDFRDTQPSKRVKILIDVPRMERLHRAKCDGRTGSADIVLRALVRVLGVQREVVVPARIREQPDWQPLPSERDGIGPIHILSGSRPDAGEG